MNEPQTTLENHERRLERWVGVFVVVAVLLLLAGFAYYLYRTAERKGWRKPRCPYYTFVESAEGLTVGDPVKLMGFNIGEIAVIEAMPPYSGYNVYVGIEVKDPYWGYILTDSKLKVTSSGLLGSRQLEVIKGISGKPTVDDRNKRNLAVLIKGKMVPLAKEPKGVFLPPDESPSITERAEKLIGQVEGALPGILSITNRLNAVLDNTAQLTSNANALVVSAQPVITNMSVITANLRDPHGSLGEWMIPTNINARLDSTLDSANFNLNLLAGNLNKTLENLAAITGSLSTQVQTNDQILAQISKLVVDTDNLVQGLKKHWMLRGVFQQKTSPKNQPLLPV